MPPATASSTIKRKGDVTLFLSVGVPLDDTARSRPDAGKGGHHTRVTDTIELSGGTSRVIKQNLFMSLRLLQRHRHSGGGYGQAQPHDRGGNGLQFGLGDAQSAAAGEKMNSTWRSSPVCWGTGTASACAAPWRRDSSCRSGREPRAICPISPIICRGLRSIP